MITACVRHFQLGNEKTSVHVSRILRFYFGAFVRRYYFVPTGGTLSVFFFLLFGPSRHEPAYSRIWNSRASLLQLKGKGELL